VDEDVETLNTFMKDIERWNERVLKQYNERKENVLAMDDLDVAKALENAEAI
jgi:sulfur relay (sulfurtransferase) DsrC/TusE family protein